MQIPAVKPVVLFRCNIFIRITPPIIPTFTFKSIIFPKILQVFWRIKTKISHKSNRPRGSATTGSGVLTRTVYSNKNKEHF